ncbi:hypothetical protein BDR26DRAFT_875112 [Obelidium mucronatum]|nr:hypothetical protein BDR26DRAFT_875112 [Obelidium mucronatum]
MQRTTQDSGELRELLWQQMLVLVVIPWCFCLEEYLPGEAQDLLKENGFTDENRIDKRIAKALLFLAVVAYLLLVFGACLHANEFAWGHAVGVSALGVLCAVFVVALVGILIGPMVFAMCISSKRLFSTIILPLLVPIGYGLWYMGLDVFFPPSEYHDLSAIWNGTANGVNVQEWRAFLFVVSIGLMSIALFWSHRQAKSSAKMSFYSLMIGIILFMAARFLPDSYLLFALIPTGLAVFVAVLFVLTLLVREFCLQVLVSAVETSWSIFSNAVVAIFGFLFNACLLMFGCAAILYLLTIIIPVVNSSSYLQVIVAYVSVLVFLPVAILVLFSYMLSMFKWW